VRRRLRHRRVRSARPTPGAGSARRRRPDPSSRTHSPVRRPADAAPGATSIVAAAASALAAGLAGHPLQAALAGAALAALLAWLSLYVRIAAPINRKLTQAASAHQTPTNARAMQHQWDHIIGLRVALQTTALALLVAVLALT
jgi:hypothetical protein